MKVFGFFVLFILLFSTVSVAQIMDLEEGEEVEGSYNIQTLITKKNAYIVLTTEKSGECEYGFEEFDYGLGNKFEKINGTLHKAKIEIEEGRSYRFKIKCVIEGERGEEDIIFSVSRISFFLLEKLEELENDVVYLKGEKMEYENKLNIDDLEFQIRELENILKHARNSLEENDIEELRYDISEGIRKKGDIENAFVIKTIQLAILDSSRYIIAIIILVYLLIYLTSSFFVPYFRIKENLNKLREKESDMIKLRKNTEVLYFHRKIDEDTFNKMVIKEQEEIMRVRTKISNIGDKQRELIKGVFEPKTVIEWSLKERVHIKDRLNKFLERIKSIKAK